MLNTIPKFNVLGVQVSAMNLDIATKAVLEALTTKQKGYVCVTGVHGVSEAQNDPEFKTILNGALLNTTDGMPLAWLGRHYVGKHVDRVYGPDLMECIFEATRATPYTHFFYGGAPGIADELKVAMETRFPGIKVVGTYCPPFRPLNEEEEQVLLQQVASLKPDIIWVGLGTPKQERFMAQFIDRLDTTLMFSVGAAFDFHTGRVKQAPRWMQRSGLEWFFRLCTEPKRLWRRYCINNPLFIWRISLQLSGLRKYTD